jgi:hypothetical protein
VAPIGAELAADLVRRQVKVIIGAAKRDTIPERFKGQRQAGLLLCLEP